MGEGWCRGPESDWLRRPFQGRALPVSYLGTRTIKDSTEKSGKWEEKTTAGNWPRRHGDTEESLDLTGGKNLGGDLSEAAFGGYGRSIQSEDREERSLAAVLAPFAKCAQGKRDDDARRIVI